MSPQEQGFEKVIEAILEYDGEGAKNICSELIESGEDPLEILEEGLSTGMEKVGDKYNALEIYLPELMMAAEAFNTAMEVVEPEIKAQQEEITSEGLIVLGTVEGDVHSIGKDIVKMLLKTAEFEVIDLGVEVPPSTFLKQANKKGADMIGMSSLLTTSMAVQEEVVKMLNETGVRDDYMVLVGGAPVTQDWADEIGADGYAETAAEAVTLAKELMEGKKVRGGK